MTISIDFGKDRDRIVAAVVAIRGPAPEGVTGEQFSKSIAVNLYARLTADYESEVERASAQAAVKSAQSDADAKIESVMNEIKA